MNDDTIAPGDHPDLNYGSASEACGDAWSDIELDLSMVGMRLGTMSLTTRLIVLRGNSASGRSAIAQAIRDRYERGLAIVGRDNIRRTILRELDQP